MQKFTIWAACAIMGATAPAAAAVVSNAQSNLANPEFVIGFDEVSVASNALVTDQFTDFGAEFEGLKFSNGFSGRPNTDGALLFDFPIRDAVISFNFAVSDATFALSSNNGTASFESFLNGALVERFTANITGTAAPNNTVGNVFGFSSSLFDEIRFTTSGSSGASFDNLSFNSAPSVVPLPASLPLLLAGFGIFGVLRRWKR